VTLAAIFALTAVVALLVVPRVIGWQPVIVLSGSMEPGIPVGGLAFLAPVEPEEVKTGDVISFGTGNTRVTHRVVEIAKVAQGTLAFRTKGDANNEADSGLVPASAVESREVLTVPHLGRVAQVLDSRLGFYAFVALPALLISVGEGVNIIKQIGQSRRRTTA
jgi:signal peptidase